MRAGKRPAARALLVASLVGTVLLSASLPGPAGPRSLADDPKTLDRETARSAGGISDPPSAAPTGGAEPGGRPAAASSGVVTATLALANNTRIPGNFLGGPFPEPESVVYDPAGGILFVGTAPTGATPALLAINPADGYVNLTVPLSTGASPGMLGYDPGTRTIWTGGLGSDLVSVLNGSTGRLAMEVVAGTGPAAVAFNTTGAIAYVANTYSSNVSVVEAASGAPLGAWAVPDPTGIAFDPVNGELFVASSDTDTVVALDPEDGEIVRQIPVGTAPSAVAWNPVDGSVYVANTGSNNLSVIDGADASVTATVSIPDPSAVAVDPASGDVYVASAPPANASASGNVSVLRAGGRSFVGIIPVGVGPVGLAIAPPLGELFVANQFSDNVSIVDEATGSAVGTLPRTVVPYGTAVDLDTGDVFVAAAETGAVGTVNRTGLLLEIDPATDRIVGGLLAPAPLYGVAFDPGNGLLYVTSPLRGTVLAVNGSSLAIVATIEAGSAPFDVAIDPAYAAVYISDLESGEVTVIDPTTESPATAVAVGPMPEGIAVDPAAGIVAVAVEGANRVAEIDEATDRVVANESTGNSSAPAAVTFDPLGPYFAAALSASSEVAFLPVEGGSPGPVQTVGLSPEAVAYSPANGLVYSVDVGSSEVTALDGATGAIVGSVSVGLAPVDLAVDPEDGELFATDEGSGAVSALSLGALPAAYPIVLSETGLPPGTLWAGTINGSLDRAEAPELLFLEPNGSYSFAVEAGPGYEADPTFGTLVVDGQGVGRPVAFHGPGPGHYLLTFREEGLPSGANWSVTFAGVRAAGTNATITMFSENGTFPYVVDGPAGYVPTPNSGAVVVDGATVNLTIRWAPAIGPGSGGPTTVDRAVLVGGLALAAAAIVVALLSRRRSRRTGRVGGAPGGATGGDE